MYIQYVNCTNFVSLDIAFRDWLELSCRDCSQETGRHELMSKYRADMDATYSSRMGKSNASLA